MILGRGRTLDFDSPVPSLSLPLCPVGTGNDFEAPQKAQSHTRTASRDNYAIHWGGTNSAKHVPPLCLLAQFQRLPDSSQPLENLEVKRHLKLQPFDLPFASNLLAF